MFGWLFGGKTFDPAKDISDLSGKIILVTGGNTGLGKETILQLAAHNPKAIYLAARNASKASAAIAEIKKVHPEANITFLEQDLTSFKSISASVDALLAQTSRLDALINNAGIMNVPFSYTSEGYEIQFGTNHMGHALLTHLLLPTLLRTAEESGSDVRIVNLSSMGHYFAALSGGIMYDPKRAEKAYTGTRYGTSKLANLLHARELARRYPTITATSVHPGAINTQLFDATWEKYKKIPLVGGWIGWISQKALGSVAEGAKNQLWAATAPREEVRKGYYFNPIGARSSGGWYTGEKEAVELWEWTESELARHGY